MLCRDNKIKIAGQVNKEKMWHARKPPYIHTNIKVFISNNLERIWRQIHSQIYKQIHQLVHQQTEENEKDARIRASLTASLFSVSVYSFICSTEATLNFIFSIFNSTTLSFLFIFRL